MRSQLPNVLELAGAAAVVYGLSLLAVWLAWVVGGLLAIVVALMLEGS